MTATHILAERKEARTQRIISALEHAEATVNFRIDEALDTLVYEGCFPSRFAGSKERNELCAIAARAAVKAVLDAANVPDEVRWLFIDQFADASEMAAVLP